MKLLLILFCLTTVQSISLPSKLLLTVYYESKCPDSRRFIVDQLAPTLSALQDYVQVKLVPFGKARSINDGNDGFECQHGPSECRGNVVQDCAIDLMAGRPDVEVINYVACEMQSLAGTKGNLQCVRNANLPAQSVQRCASSRRGVDLQLRSEQLTKTIRPAFVPTVTVNGYFDQQIQNESQRDLSRTICSLIPEAEPCSQLQH